MPEVIVTNFEDLEHWGSTLFNALSNKDKVFIKPNLINDSPPSSGVTTDLRIVASLIRILKNIGVTDVMVGESAILSTEDVLKKHNFYSLKDYGVKTLNLDKAEWIKVESGMFESFKRFHLPKAVLEADVIISVPKMKTHAETGVTLSIKNLIGLIPRGDRMIAHKGNINEAIVAVFQYLNAQKKFFSVVDGIIALEGRRGPVIGNTVKLGLIIMGSDPLAVDSTCVRIMGAKPKDILHIDMACALGLGVTDNIEILGKDINKVKRNFVFPDINFPDVSKGYKLGFIYGYVCSLFKKYPYMLAQEKCTQCMGCINICPMECITHNYRRIFFDYTMCINCLCCCEVCKTGALDYEVRHKKLYTILKRFKDTAKRLIDIIRCII